MVMGDTCKSLGSMLVSYLVYVHYDDPERDHLNDNLYDPRCVLLQSSTTMDRHSKEYSF